MMIYSLVGMMQVGLGIAIAAASPLYNAISAYYGSAILFPGKLYVKLWYSKMLNMGGLL
jgi:hypothetical protein